MQLVPCKTLRGREETAIRTENLQVAGSPTPDGAIAAKQETDLTEFSLVLRVQRSCSREGHGTGRGPCEVTPKGYPRDLQKIVILSHSINRP